LSTVLGGRGHGRVFAGIGLGIFIDVGHFGFHAFDVAGLFALAGLLVVLAVVLLALAFALFGRLVGALGLLWLAVVAIVLVSVLGVFHFPFGDEVEVAQHGTGGLGEGFLVLISAQKRIDGG